jgi:hypothetical protein
MMDALEIRHAMIGVEWRPRTADMMPALWPER